MLTAPEIRVLGCLVEKQLATPQAYPLTESALVAACNQSTNRDPVVSYDVNAVRRALIGLRQHGLAREVHRPGERAAKHRHLLDEAWDLSVAEVAVLAVLALRGPQTAAELRSRTERLHRFGSVEDVEAVLDRLAEHAAGPLAQLQERRPGQKEARWAHRLLDPDAEPEEAATTGEGAPTAPAEAGGPRVSLLALAAEVEQLKAEVAALREALSALQPAPEER
jgi:uncharacterized protein